MDNNVNNIFGTESVITELAKFFTSFNELLNMELSPEARNIIGLVLYDLLGSKNDDVTIDNNNLEPVDDELPNEYAQRSKPVETPKPEHSTEHPKMFEGYTELMDGSNKRITGKRLYKEFKYYISCYPGLKMSPEDYLKSIIVEELTQIGYDTENDLLYEFLMNACHIDFSKHFFDGEPGDNPFTMERSIGEQLGVDVKLNSLLHNSTTKGHDLSRSALLGLPVYRDGSMRMMNLLSYYCELISEFMIEASKDE